MSNRKTHLGAARSHGRRALKQLRLAAADSALYWVLSHRDRVAKFRRAVKGTPAAKAVDQLLGTIRDEATPLPARRAPKARRVHRRRRTAVARYFAQPFAIG